MGSTKSSKFAPRKLLVAAVGVATINYVAACLSSSSSPPTSGNLPGPEPETMTDAARDTGPDTYIPPTSGNLPAPPPMDAGADADAEADADADAG